ncbi:MAG: PA2779 family protein, partial [Gammaproteobacteria bacterium]|nr:PA2779 family protein [Gammaproteobacteria bacterium]
MSINPAKFLLGLVCALALAAGSLSTAFAGMVGTEQLLVAEQVQMDREQLLATLSRAEVKQQLSDMGVDPLQAAERVARMTDAEIAALSEGLGDLPAGSGVLGAVVLIFVVFVITDVIGATDIFPF